VTVACGSYGDVGITSSVVRSSGPNVVFDPVTPYCVTLGTIHLGSQTMNFSTFHQFNIVSPDGAIYQSGTQPTYGVVFDGNHMNVAKPLNTQDINFHSANGLRFVNNTVGPTCCGTGSDSPEGMRFGIPTGAPNSANVLIDNNVIQGAVRNCAYWPATYEMDGQTYNTGPCPAASCSSCHADGIHVWGMQNSTISNNRVVGNEVQGIYFEPTNGAVNRDNAITGNTVSIVGGSAAGIYLSALAPQGSFAGTWTIDHNDTTNTAIEIGSGFAGDAPGTIYNVTNNVGRLFITNSSGNNAGCYGYPSGTTINYSGNTWTTGGGYTSGCP
jgi:parallel beta-helix repeat protein